MHPVQWDHPAINDLAELWMAGDSGRRDQIADAVLDVDRRLAADPANEGESRDRGQRILLVPPLAILYRVGREGVVHVMNVWRYPVR